jgi:glycosyltransferase involved in cell wall biosynthesis
MRTVSVSLVATVRDERRSIEGFLGSLLEQTRVPDEIVVVDGGSTDGTWEALGRLASTHPALIVLRRPGANIATGRNVAIQVARGEVVAVADAGTVASPTWLERLVAPLEEDRGLAVSGGFFVPGGGRWLERTITAIITPQLTEVDPDRFLPSSRSVAFRKEWWARAGGYPEWLDHCEDLVFDLELKRAGGRFTFVPDALVTWSARPTLRAFFRQYLHYARGDGRARLYGRRHAIRYGAYLAGTGLVCASSRRPVLLLVLAGAGAAYMSKFLRRVVNVPPGGTRAALGGALALAPVVVVVGDVAKMIGYPRGRWERRRSRAARRPGSG